MKNLFLKTWDLLWHQGDLVLVGVLCLNLLGLFGCDQELTSTKDQPLVDYTVTVTDSATNLPLDSVRIRMITIGGDTSVYFTNALEGRSEAATVESGRTLFVLNRSGFRTLNQIDTVTTPRDTAFGRPLVRLLTFKMSKILGNFVLVQSTPKDTVASDDTLAFRFSEPIATVENVVVQLTNLAGPLWTSYWLSDSGKTLKLVQRDGNWLTGKRYDYSLSLRNSQGAYFIRQNDTGKILRGSFTIRDSILDTNLIYPSQIRLAYFNSGTYSRFDSLNVETSPKADSTTRFARLKWNWNKTQGTRVDSLLILIKDGAAAAPSWVVWMGIPGFVDSATLDFANLYSTTNAHSQKPTFPLSISSKAEIFIRIVPKKGNQILENRDTLLSPIRQEMGPSLYVAYLLDHKLNDSLNAEDSLDAVFLTSPNDSSSIFDFGATPPTPRLYLTDKVDSTILSWLWVSSTRGRLFYHYRGRGNPLANTTFRVDLNGVFFHGAQFSGPIWLRNPQNRILLP